jgi:hypothetical protein
LRNSSALGSVFHGDRADVALLIESEQRVLVQVAAAQKV